MRVQIDSEIYRQLPPGNNVEVANCLNKVTYYNVRNAIWYGKRNLGLPDTKEKVLWWYRCPVCRGIHLTSSNCGRKYKITLEEN